LSRVDERIQRPRRRARTVIVNDDRAVAAFVSSWLARHGLVTAPVGGGIPVAGETDDEAVDSPGTPVMGLPVTEGALPEDATVPAVPHIHLPAGPGSPLAYPSPSLWIDPPAHLALGPLDIDTGRRSVRVLGQDVHLTPTEYRLLCYLVEHSDRVVGHRELLLSVWGPGYGDDVHLLQVTIRSLRARMASIEDCPLIESVYGTGYRMASWPEPESLAKPLTEASTSRS
jgi:DNA-binding winged helix-turn-helix (wHTH) protein